MMWDDGCETKARELLDDFVHGVCRPALVEQQALANWLNQRLPYPGWVFEVVSDAGGYWATLRGRRGQVYYRNDGYIHTAVGKKTDTLMEMMTALELGL